MKTEKVKMVKQYMINILALYLSKYNQGAYSRLGEGAESSIRNDVAAFLNYKGSTLKLRRDDFDSHHDLTSREGWKSDLSFEQEVVWSACKDFSEEELWFVVQRVLLYAECSDVSEFMHADDFWKALGIGDSLGYVSAYERGNHQNKSVIEGEVREQFILSYGRNALLVDECKKRDKYTCQSCGFYYNNRIVEAHHLKPLNLGSRVSCVEDLITLCPTCHRLAHSIAKDRDKDLTCPQTLLAELSNLPIS